MANSIERSLFVTDAQGVEHKLRNPNDLQAFLATLTPEQLETWKLVYRFTPVRNQTGIRDYTGTIRDLL